MQKFWTLERTIVKHRSSSRVYLLEKEELIINREIKKTKVEGSILRIDERKKLPTISIPKIKAALIEIIRSQLTKLVCW